MAEARTTSPFHSEGEPILPAVSVQMSSLGPVPALQDEVLQQVVKGVEAQTGERFFDALVEELAKALGVKYAYLSEFNRADGCFYSKAGWSPKGLLPRFPVPVSGPCEVVLNHQVVHHADGLADCYPSVQVIKDWGAVSYCGLPLIDSSGKVAGHLAVLDDKPMPHGEQAAAIMRIFAARVLAELECQKLEQARKRSEGIFQYVLRGTASVLGEEFFRALVEHVATGFGFRYAFVTECLPDHRARSLAFWQHDRFGENFEYDLSETPCQDVVAGRTCFHPSDLQQRFPKDVALQDMHVESYHGLPIVNSAQSVIGHLVVMDDKPMRDDPVQCGLLEAFAMRAGAELERWRAFQDVHRLNTELSSLVNINSAIGRYLNRDELFGAVANCLTDLVHMERFGVEIPLEGDKLLGHIFTGRPEVGQSTQRTLLPAAGTVCDWVIQNRQWFVASSCEELRTTFPVTYSVMSKYGLESLLVLPLVSGGQSTAALYFMASTKGAYAHLRQAFFEQVAGAVAVALDNCLAHEQLREESRQALAESEERLKDLFDEAPIAYVNEGLDSKFIRANRAAMNTLGITPDQVEGTYGKTFIPNTPEAQKRLKEAFDSIGRGTDTSGVVLELRRKDTGKPLWIQWWSRPDPSGTYTRTMFLDITDKVLMEQEKARLEAQNTYLREEIQSVHNFEEVIGSSSSLKKVLRNVERVAPTDSTVLVTGETGTGKELIARAIHNLSPRKSKPLVKVNCAAIPAGLIESELFGHEKGAFTGALTKKIGRFELADKGTIFLDEIGELPLDLQAKLLRVLQEGEFERVGGTQTFKVNVRVIAATNRDLEHLSRTGHYRSDLYYRLNVFPIHLPSLREREGDIPLLAQYFVRKCATNLGKRIDRIPESMMATLRQYPWPGNIRELEHVIERAVILTEGSSLEPIELSAGGRGGGASQSVTTLEERERLHIVEVLEQTGWRVSGKAGAAELLGLKPTTLEARMKKLGIARKK